MKEAVSEELATLRAARFVRETREAARFSQSKLASELNISQARVSQIESGKGKYGLSVALLERIAEACGGRLELKFSKLSE
jgi:transcriptional regulator with XRE-family HTH domain